MLFVESKGKKMFESIWPYLLSAFVGGSLVLLGEYLFLCWLEKPAKKLPDAPECPRFTIPQDLLHEILKAPITDSSEAALNAAVQFIFQQSTADTRWLRMKLGKELSELLLKTPGKIFESLRLNSLDVGSEFPTIRNVRMLHCSDEPDTQRLKSLDLQFDVSYDGNFTAEVLAVLLLGRSANIYISVKSLHGKVRMMLRRHPYTHWALAFEEPPDLQLVVHGSFQGRTIRQRIASIVSSQIHKAILQKHTLPNYKIRYKPFFPKKEPQPIDLDMLSKEPPSGSLSVYILEVSRLLPSSTETKIRVTVSVDSFAWVSYKDGELVFDVKIERRLFQNLGVVCRQALGNTVVVDTVVPMTPAYDADIRRGDIIVAIESKPVTNVNQVGRLFRSTDQTLLSVRIKRPKMPVVPPRDSAEVIQPEYLVPEAKKAKSFSFRRVSEVMEGVRLQSNRVQSKILQTEPPQPNTSKNTADTIQKDENIPLKDSDSSIRSNASRVPENCPSALRKRRCSVEKASSDSSAGSTPSTSGQNTPQKIAHEPNCPSNSLLLNDDEWNFMKCYSETCTHEPCRPNYEIFQHNSTRWFGLVPIILIKCAFLFMLNRNQKYLNVNVWGKVDEESEQTLLGYLNIPLDEILSECKDVQYGQHMRRYTLHPPDFSVPFRKTHELASHNGFDPNLCYGDILLWCCWEGNRTKRKQHLFDPSQYSYSRKPSTESYKKGEELSKHKFVRTHFNRSTLCDFCNKKIWLKDAMQCESCGLCCHKKCMIKCQETTPCSPAPEVRETSSETSEVLRMPEVITTEADSVEDADSDEELLRVLPDESHEDTALSTMQNLVAGLRRVSSTHSLSAPRNSSGQARSLPPSPSHTPRKQSINTNPFAGTGETWRKGGVASLLPSIEAADLPPDALLAAARDSAPELAATLSLELLHDMLNSIQLEMDNSNNETRSMALNALMLHCCAAAQLAEQNASAQQQQSGEASSA